MNERRRPPNPWLLAAAMLALDAETGELVERDRDDPAVRERLDRLTALLDNPRLSGPQSDG